MTVALTLYQEVILASDSQRTNCILDAVVVDVICY